MTGKKLLPLSYQDRKRVSTVDRLSNVDTMMDDAYSILGEQIEKMRLKSRNATFTDKEAKILQTYIRSLVDLSEEERELQKSVELDQLMASLSDEQLLELAKSKLGK